MTKHARFFLLPSFILISAALIVGWVMLPTY